MTPAIPPAANETRKALLEGNPEWVGAPQRHDPQHEPIHFTETVMTAVRP